MVRLTEILIRKEFDAFSEVFTICEQHVKGSTFIMGGS